MCASYSHEDSLHAFGWAGARSFGALTWTLLSQTAGWKRPGRRLGLWGPQSQDAVLALSGVRMLAVSCYLLAVLSVGG